MPDEMLVEFVTGFGLAILGLLGVAGVIALIVFVCNFLDEDQYIHESYVLETQIKKMDLEIRGIKGEPPFRG